MFTGLVDKVYGFVAPRPRRCRKLIYELSGTGEPPRPNSGPKWFVNVIVENQWTDNLGWQQCLLSVVQSYRGHFTAEVINDIFQYFILNDDEDYPEFERTLSGCVNGLHSKMCDQFTHPDWQYKQIDITFR